MDRKIRSDTLSTFYTTVVDRLVLRELLVLIVIDHCHLMEIVSTLRLNWIVCVWQAC